MAEQKQISKNEFYMKMMEEIIKKGEELDPDGIVVGGELLHDLTSRLFKPETREDRALAALVELEYLEASGKINASNRAEFLNRRDLAAVRAGLMNPEEATEARKSREQGTGWVESNGQVRFLGDVGPDGKHHTYAAGSEEAKKRQAEIEKKRADMQARDSAPSPLFQYYQKAYDERKVMEQVNQLEKEKLDPYSNWAQGGDLRSAKGAKLQPVPSLVPPRSAAEEMAQMQEPSTQPSAASSSGGWSPDGPSPLRRGLGQMWEDQKALGQSMLKIGGYPLEVGKWLIGKRPASDKEYEAWKSGQPQQTAQPPQDQEETRTRRRGQGAWR